jgi:spermidine synthase
MKSTPNTFKARTKYTSFSIIESADRIELRSETGALLSAIDRKKPQKLVLANLEYLMGILLFLRAPQNILLLGTGGGSLIHFLRYHYPMCRLTSVDFDAELQELMHQKMLLPSADDNLVYIIDEASHYLRNCEHHFDLILVDIFSGSQSPGWLLESPGIRRLNGLLTGQGAVAYNLLVDSDFAFNLFYRQLAQVFEQQTLYLPVEGFENTLVYAFRKRPPRHQMSYYIDRAMEMAEIHEIDYQSLLSTIYTTNPVGSAVIY